MAKVGLGPGPAGRGRPPSGAATTAAAAGAVCRRIEGQPAGWAGSPPAPPPHLHGPPLLPPPLAELDQWIRACRGGAPSDASFERVYPFAETILLGTIAQRVPGKLRWDSTRARFTNAPAEATALLTRQNRPGWEI